MTEEYSFYAVNTMLIYFCFIYVIIMLGDMICKKLKGNCKKLKGNCKKICRCCDNEKLKASHMDSELW